jgi:hypothetical protein
MIILHAVFCLFRILYRFSSFIKKGHVNMLKLFLFCHNIVLTSIIREVCVIIN